MSATVDSTDLGNVVFEGGLSNTLTSYLKYPTGVAGLYGPSSTGSTALGISIDGRDYSIIVSASRIGVTNRIVKIHSLHCGCVSSSWGLLAMMNIDGTNYHGFIKFEKFTTTQFV